MTKALALVFTFNVSLEIWHRQGLLDREKLIYERLLASGLYREIFWFTYGAGDARYQGLLKDGIVVVPMPKIFDCLPGKLIYSVFMPLVRVRRFHRCAVIKTNQMAGSWTAVLASWIHGRPLMARSGFTWSRNAAKQRVRTLDRFAAFCEWFAYRACDVAIVTDGSQARYVADRYRIGAGKVRVIPNFIDVDRFKPAAGPGPEKNRVVFVGRLSGEKNLENLVTAFAGLPVGLDIYGDGPLRQQLVDKAGALGADVRFRGSVPNASVPDILNRYAVFILPSLFEGSPKSLLEAMACGLACIGTAVDGIRDDVIRHGENGWLVDVDAASIREGIKTLTNDGDLRDRLGRNARRFIVEGFSLDRIDDLETAAHRRLLNAS